jgi:hypothetical protein
MRVAVKYQRAVGKSGRGSGDIDFFLFLDFSIFSFFTKT